MKQEGDIKEIETGLKFLVRNWNTELTLNYDTNGNDSANDYNSKKNGEGCYD